MIGPHTATTTSGPASWWRPPRTRRTTGPDHAPKKNLQPGPVDGPEHALANTVHMTSPTTSQTTRAPVPRPGAPTQPRLRGRRPDRAPCPWTTARERDSGGCRRRRCPGIQMSTARSVGSSSVPTDPAPAHGNRHREVVLVGREEGGLQEPRVKVVVDTRRIQHRRQPLGMPRGVADRSRQCGHVFDVHTAAAHNHGRRRGTPPPTNHRGDVRSIPGTLTTSSAAEHRHHSKAAATQAEARDNAPPPGQGSG